MRFNVAQLLKERIGSTRDYDIEEDSALFGPDVPVTGPVSGHVQLLRTPKGVLARAHLATEARLECSRCLAEFTVPLDFAFEEEYQSTIDINTGLPISDVDSDLRITENHLVDLTEAGRQYALLNLPMQPLCSELCQGLCPHCGADLNAGRCACDATGSDSKLAAGLRQWLDQQENRS